MVKAKSKTAKETKALSAPADNDKAKKLPTVIETSEYGLQLRTLDDMYRFGKYVCEAGMVPRPRLPRKSA